MEAPIRYRTWLLSSNETITPDGAKFLTSLGITVRAGHEVRTQSQTYYYGPRKIEFETTCDEQESVLKLKYGKNLTLFLEEMVFPHTWRVCTLDRIEWKP